MRKIIRTRELNLKVLILCEGLTEKNYLLELKQTLPREKQRGIKIEIELFKKNDPLNLVNEAIKRKAKAKREGIPYDNIWVVFDHDNLPNRDKAFNKAGINKISIAFSSINIEFWFILHFEYTTRPFKDGNEAKKYFRDNYCKDYEPGKSLIYSLTKTNYHTAFTNAQKLTSSQGFQLQAGQNIWNLNPYLTIHNLTDFLLKI